MLYLGTSAHDLNPRIFFSFGESDHKLWSCFYNLKYGYHILLFLKSSDKDSIRSPISCKAQHNDGNTLKFNKFLLF